MTKPTPAAALWQPIETAPRDGTKIVLYSPDWQQCPIARWELVEGSDENSGGAYCLWILDDTEAGSQQDGLLWPHDDGEPMLWAPLPIAHDEPASDS